MISGVQNSSYQQTAMEVGNAKKQSDNDSVDKTAKERSDSYAVYLRRNSPALEDLKMNGGRVVAYGAFSGDRKRIIEIDDLLDGYYSGEKSLEDVKKEFDELVEKIQELDEELGVAEKGDAEHYWKIVSDVYHKFKMSSVQSAFGANQREGKALADQYGKPGKRNFIYYNSDYYYKSEELNDLLAQHASKKLEDAGAEEPLCTKTLNPSYENFNTFMKHWVQYECFMGDILDTDMEPPRGFTFLYKEERYTQAEIDTMAEKIAKSNSTAFDGLLRVSYGDWSKEGNVNLRYDLSEAEGFSVFELLGRFADIGKDDLLVRFMKNFNIHRTGYNGLYLRTVGSFKQFSHNC